MLLCQEAKRIGGEIEIKRELEIGIEMKMREHGWRGRRERMHNNEHM